MKIQVLKKARQKSRSPIRARIWSKCCPRPRRSSRDDNLATKGHTDEDSRASRTPASKVRVSDPCPYLGGDPARGREEVTAAAATLAAAGRAIHRGVAGNRRFDACYASCERSAVHRCRDAAACAACGGDARRRPSSEPLAVRIGRSLPKSGRSPLVDLAGVFSSEPLVAAAWDGRPVFRLAESLVESDGWPAPDGHAAAATSASTTGVRHGAGRARPSGEEGRRAAAGDRRPRWRSTIGACSSRLQQGRRRSSREDLARCIVDSNEPERIGLAHRPVQARLAPSRWCSNDSTSYYRGSPRIERIEMHAVRHASGGLDGHDAAARSNVLHEVNRDVDRVPRSRRRHPRLPVAPALLHRARLQHAPSDAEARARCGVAHQRGDRPRRDRSQGDARPRTGRRRSVLAVSLGLHAAAFPVAFNPEAARARLDAAGLAGARRHARHQMASRFQFTCLFSTEDASSSASPCWCNGSCTPSASTCRSSRCSSRSCAALDIGRLRGVPSRDGQRPLVRLGLSLLALARPGPADRFR